MIDSYIDLFKFVCIFVLICIAVFAVLKRLSALTLTKGGITAKFDFYVDTKNELKDPDKWQVKKIDDKDKECSLAAFKFFVVNDVWQQVPLSQNDIKNFTKMKELCTKPDNDEVIKKFWQRNYLFNIKFSQITELVKEYQSTWNEVMLEKSI